MFTVVLTVSVSLFGVFIGITFQKYMNDRDKKFTAYVELMEALAESASGGDIKKANKQYLLAKQKIIFYGSKKAVNQLSKIPNFNASNPNEYMDYLELIKIMRSEASIFPKRQSIPEDILKKILG
ncbi:hypothetical protein [Pectinatus frisingensis]|uniref:hypothetical protein n=1 Tax=Pectinatus frisingensis TaxID=865 RepID=UPI003D8045BB